RAWGRDGLGHCRYSTSVTEVSLPKRPRLAVLTVGVICALYRRMTLAAEAMGARDALARRQGRLALGAALVSVGLWASAFVGIRSAVHEVAPGALALGRLLVGCVILGSVVLLRREPLPPRRSLPGIVVSGVLWFGIYNVALNLAERRVDAGTAAMLVNLGPILIALLAGALLHEGFPRGLLLGCVVGFAGAAVIGAATSEHGVGASWGAGLCVIAAFAYAGAVVAQKPVLREASPLQVTWLACAVGALSCLPFGGALVRDVGDAHTSAIAWVVYLGAMPTALGFLAWTYALARMPAGRLGPLTYLVPALAILLGWGILGETPPP